MPAFRLSSLQYLHFSSPSPPTLFLDFLPVPMLVKQDHHKYEAEKPHMLTDQLLIVEIVVNTNTEAMGFLVGCKKNPPPQTPPLPFPLPLSS